MLEKLKEQFLAHLLLTVIFPSLLLFVGTVWTLSPILIDPLWKQVPVPTLQRIWCTSLLSILALVTYIFYLRRKESQKLRLYSGLYWDRNANAYCPGCKSPLTGYTVSDSGHHLGCVKCTAVALRDNQGGNLPLKDAQDFVLRNFHQLERARA